MARPPDAPLLQPSAVGASSACTRATWDCYCVQLRVRSLAGVRLRAVWNGCYAALTSSPPRACRLRWRRRTSPTLLYCGQSVSSVHWRLRRAPLLLFYAPRAVDLDAAIESFGRLHTAADGSGGSGGRYVRTYSACW